MYAFFLIVILVAALVILLLSALYPIIGRYVSGIFKEAADQIKKD